MGKIFKRSYLLLLVKIVITIFGGCFLAYICFPQSFQLSITKEQLPTVTIKALAKSFPFSEGSDVAISEIQINGNSFDLSNVSLNSVWKYENGTLTYCNPQEPQELVYAALDMQEISITFLRNSSSGLIGIYENGRLRDILNLYSAEEKYFTWTSYPGLSVSVFANPLLFLILLSGLWMFIDAIILLQKHQKKFNENKKNTLTFIGMYVGFVVLYAKNIGFWISLRQDIMYLFFCCFVLSIAWGLCTERALRKNFQTQKTQTFLKLLFFFLVPAGAFAIVEMIHGDGFLQFSIDRLLRNYFLYLFLESACAALFFSVKTASLITAGSTAIYGFINYYVMRFRGVPLSLSDFFSWQTALNVSMNYDYTLTLPALKALLLCTVLIILICKLLLPSTFWLTQKCLFKKLLIRSGTLGITILGIASILLNTEFLSVTLSQWDYENDLQENGVLFSFAVQTRSSYVTKPTAYSEENLMRIRDSYTEKNHFSSEFPNIIVIMNESFADLNQIRDFDTSLPVLETYNNLKDNVIKGYAYTSVFGGKTCNTEYEFLTGNTMAFLPDGSVPFQQYIKEEEYSIASLLSNIGYYTIGIHPYFGNGWNREKVYPALGFDEFLDIEDFDSTDMVRGCFLSDNASYEKVIEEFEAAMLADQPVFIFNVTIQNHGNYKTNAFSANELVRITNAPGKYPEAEEYLTLIQKSDKAIIKLINYFKNITKPTIILFFGDHQPALGDGFYEYLYQKNLNMLTLDEMQRRYKVPFFIWANYEIENQIGIETSINYLSSILLETSGLPLTPYASFLNTVQSAYPVINPFGVKIKDNNSWEELDTGGKTLLSDYENIQYNNIFDENKIADFYYY